MKTKTALVLIDVQNDYFEGGKKELFAPDKALAAGAKILAKAREAGLTIVHVRHIAKAPGATFFVEGTPGSEIHQGVAPRTGEKIIIKHFPNSFRETELDSVLRSAEIKRIIFCGMMSHICVDTTVRAAKDLGYECVLIHDACTTCDLEFAGTNILAATVHASFMAALSGMFAEVVSSEYEI